MRRFIILFATALFAYVGWSQTVTINFNDGTTVKYSMSKIQSIEFTENDDEDVEVVDGSTAIIGTWKASDVEGWDVLDKYGTWTGDYFQLKSDGTFLRVSSNHAMYYGDWKLSDNVLTLHYTDDALLGSRISYDVLSLDQNSMVLALWGLKIYCKKVSEDEMNTYLSNKQ